MIERPEYWVADIQLRLFEMIHGYMDQNGLSQTQFAEQLGVTKGYISQILNGDYNHKVSKLVSLSLAAGKVPVLQFMDADEFLKKESNEQKGHTNNIMLDINTKLNKFA